MEWPAKPIILQMGVKSVETEKLKESPRLGTGGTIIRMVLAESKDERGSGTKVSADFPALGLIYYYETNVFAENQYIMEIYILKLR